MKAGALLLGIALAGAFAGGRAGARRNPFEGRPEAVLAGAKLYRRHCAGCHGDQAQGLGRAAALRRPNIRNAPEGWLFRTLTDGVLKRGMPSWSHLPEERRWQIVSYLKSLE